MEYVLIIGGSGYIGLHISRCFLEKGYKVIIYDNLSNSYEYLTLKLKTAYRECIFIEGDINKYDELVKTFSTYDISAVVYLAAKISVAESIKKPLDYYKVNINGLVDVLKIMTKFKVRNIIFSSTAGLYDDENKRNVILDENSKIGYTNDYSFSKKVGEEIIINSSFVNNINYVIFRFFNVAGASTDSFIGAHTKKEVYHLIPVINETVIGRREIVYVYGNKHATKDGYCVRDYIHVEDIAIANYLAFKGLTNSKFKNEIINLGSGKGYSVIEIINKCAEYLNKKINYELVGERNFEPDFLVASNLKAKKLLGWQNKKTLKDMIVDDFIWRKNNNI